MNKKIFCFAMVCSLFMTSCGLFDGPHGGDFEDHDHGGDGEPPYSEPEPVPVEGDDRAYIKYIPCEGLKVNFSKMEGNPGEEFTYTLELIDDRYEYEVYIVNDHDLTTINKNWQPEQERLRGTFHIGKNPVYVEKEELDERDINLDEPEYVEDKAHGGMAINHAYSWLNFEELDPNVVAAKPYSLNYKYEYYRFDTDDTTVNVVSKQVKYIEKYAFRTHPDTTIFMEENSKTADIDDEFVAGGGLVLWGCQKEILTFSNAEAKYYYSLYDGGNKIAIHFIERIPETIEAFHIPETINGVKVTALLTKSFIYNSILYLSKNIETIQVDAIDNNKLVYVPGHDLKPGFRKGFTSGSIRFYGDGIEYKDEYINETQYIYLVHSDGVNPSYIDIISVPNNTEWETINFPDHIHGIPVRGILNFQHGWELENRQQTVHIANGVTHIFENAFKAFNFKSFEIPNSVTYLGAGAIPKVSDTLTWPNSVTSVAPYTFEGKLPKKIINQEVITDVEYSGFYGCDLDYVLPNLTHVSTLGYNTCNIHNTIQQNIDYEYNAFYSSVIPYFEFNDNNEKVKLNTFESSNIINLIISGEKDIEFKCVSDDHFGVGELYITSNNPHKKVLKFLCRYNSYLENALDNYFVDGAYNDENFLYILEKGSNTATIAASKVGGTKVVIPDEIKVNNKTIKVTRIGSGAFSFYHGQTYEFGENIESIAYHGFGNNIGTYHFNDKLVLIASQAFNGKERTITEPVYIPKSVKYIGKDAFEGFTNINCESETFQNGWDPFMADLGTVIKLGVPRNQVQEGK